MATTMFTASVTFALLAPAAALAAPDVSGKVVLATIFGDLEDVDAGEYWQEDVDPGDFGGGGFFGDDDFGDFGGFDDFDF